MRKNIASAGGEAGHPGWSNMFDFAGTRSAVYPNRFTARTIAKMPSRIGSGSAGQVSTISRRSASAGIGGETATDAFAAPAAETSASSPESAGF